MVRLPLPLLLPPLVILLLAPPATAHAVLQSADPAPNGNAPAGLGVVEIRFTEDVEREYTGAEVVDLGQRRLDAGAVEFDEKRRNVIRVPVQPLPDGIYTVIWRTLSVDTHTARGTFLFSVGNATLKFVDETESHDHSLHSASRVVPEGIARAVFYAGLFAALGLPVFVLAVDRERDVPRRALVALALLALAGAVGGAVVLRFFALRIEAGLGVAVSTTAGSLLAWRAGLLGLGGAIALAALASRGSRRAPTAAVAAVAVASLLATSLGSHAAALKEGRILAITLDAMHLAMAAVWIGGVLGFLLVLPGRAAGDAGRLVARFSPLAVASVALVLATGVYASVRHMPSIESLWRDGYGRLVALKALLLIPLLALGAYNRYRLGPRLLYGWGDSRTLRRVLGVEAIVMIAIVAFAGVLASSAPPDRDVEEGSQGPPPYLELENETRTTHVVLRVRPNPPVVGLQRVSVALHPLDGKPLPNATEIALKFSGPGEAEPDGIVIPEKIRLAEWSHEDSVFTSPGTWKVYVIVQRPDEYKKLVFDVEVGTPGAASGNGQE